MCTNCVGSVISHGISVTTSLPFRVAKTGEMSPGSEVALLDRVACELRVPEDEPGCRVQPHDGRVDELREGLMIAPLRSLDEKSLVHANLARCTGSVHSVWRRRLETGSRFLSGTGSRPV